jgi:nicotinic acid mononucleotide adenylyltransferase
MTSRFATSKFNPENEIIFTIARMNPPTPGHKLVIKTMMLKALELGLSQINIILSSTVDNKKNPIECEEKRMILYNHAIPEIQKELVKEYPEYESQIEEINAEIICMDDETNPRYGSHPIFSKVNYVLCDLYNCSRKGAKMYLVIGEDRKDSYDWIIKTLASREAPIDVEVIGIERPEDAMSATFLRGLALSGKEEDRDLFFEHMRELGIDDYDISNVYEQIQKIIKPTVKRGTSASFSASATAKSTARGIKRTRKYKTKKSKKIKAHKKSKRTKRKSIKNK